MTDLISRKATMEVINDVKGVTWSQSGVVLCRKMYSQIKDLSAVDAVPVVRCKDCKHRPIDHREEYDEITGFGLEFPDSYCPCRCEDGWYNWFPDDDWFCANGERRDGE